MPTLEELGISPTPWSPWKSDDQLVIRDSKGNKIAQVLTNEDDAEYICNAVNQHKRLISLLGLMMTNLDYAWEYINESEAVRDKLYDAMDEAQKVIMEDTLKEVNKVLEREHARPIGTD